MRDIDEHCWTLKAKATPELILYLLGLMLPIEEEKESHKFRLSASVGL
jgi:hypothetical protein